MAEELNNQWHKRVAGLIDRTGCKPGNRAELIVVEDDPVEDVSHSESISYIFAQGRIFQRRDCQRGQLEKAKPMLKVFYFIACIFSLANGAWMIFFPMSWYRDLPAAIPHTGPFNAHFIRDIGVAYAVAGFAFGWCALNLNSSRPMHWGVTLFFGGHALVHIVEITTGHLPHSHWSIDAPSVFVPAVLLLILSVPAIRRRLGER